MNSSHFLLQKTLLDQYPKDLQMEVSMGERRADLLMENKKLVLEIQISPISVKEVQAREKFYNSQGYRVIWLLHPQRYNKKFLKPEEGYLRKKRSVFLFIDGGRVRFYRQQETFFFRKRTSKSHPQFLTLDELAFLEEKKPPVFHPLLYWKQKIERRLDQFIQKHS